MIIKYIYTIFIIFLSINRPAYANSEFKIISAENGPLRGKQQFTLFDKKPYYAFLGIPYGKPPINNLRFKPTVRPDSWKCIKNAFIYGNKCVQGQPMDGKLIGNEDCLYLNVYTPDACFSQKMAVMVFLYGGGYRSGYSNCYGPDFLIENDVVIVTINYRVGAMGFLSLGTDEYSGNAGLKDQLLALKWVQTNIAAFNGDPEKVTLFGQSAGASSTNLHILSDASRGLFKRAIMESGAALNYRATLYNNNQTQQLQEFAKQYGNINTENIDTLTEFLKHVDPYLLTKNSSMLPYPPFTTEFAPVVESSSACQPILIKSPLDYLLEKPNDKIDTLFGFNSGEALYFIKTYIKNPALLDSFNKTFPVLLPFNFLKYNNSSEMSSRMAMDIRKFYFENKQVNFTTINNLTNFVTDFFLSYAIYTTALLQSRRTFGKTYLYENSMKTKLNIFTQISGATKYGLHGVSHVDELFYIFRITCSLFGETYIDPYKNLRRDSIEYKLIRSTSAQWANFAKFGHPTVVADDLTLKPIKSNRYVNYVHLTNDGPVADINPIENRFHFWNNFFQKYDTFLE